MVSVTSVSRYQKRSSMYTRGLIPLKSTKLGEAVPIGTCPHDNGTNREIVLLVFFFIFIYFHNVCMRGVKGSGETANVRRLKPSLPVVICDKDKKLLIWVT